MSFGLYSILRNFLRCLIFWDKYFVWSVSDTVNKVISLFFKVFFYTKHIFLTKKYLAILWYRFLLLRSLDFTLSASIFWLKTEMCLPRMENLSNSAQIKRCQSDGTILFLYVVDVIIDFGGTAKKIIYDYEFFSVCVTKQVWTISFY